MPTYKYKAVKQSGEVFKGSVSAQDKDDLAQKVRDLGGALVDFSNQDGSKLAFLKNLALFETISAQDKIIFAKNLGAMVKAGLSVSKALTTLEKQFKSKKFKGIIRDLNSDIKQGKTINASLMNHPKVFSQLFTSMVRAGEESGDISGALETVCTQMENANNLKKKVKGAMIYPAIIIIAMVVVGILMLLFIVPTLQATFADMDVELPMSTQIIIGFSSFLKDHTILFLAVIIALIVGFVFAFRSENGKKYFDTILLKIPLIGVIAKEVNSARTARTLSSLLTSGVDVISTFDIAKDVVQNHHYKKVLEQARDSVQKGSPVAQIFVESEDLYPPVVGAMIEVGEETGKLPDMLLSVADFYENEVAQKTKNMSTIIEPVLMVIIGGAVGFFAVSMITPMYSVMSGI